MTGKKSMRYVTTNELGMRIGQDHPKAVLTDIEVDALIRDRGPDEAPLMSYGQLSRKYGISKSSVRDILVGRRRGQAKVLVRRDETHHAASKAKVRLNIRLSLRARSILNRLGGSRWLEHVAGRIDAQMRRAPHSTTDVVAERVLERAGVKK